MSNRLKRNKSKTRLTPERAVKLLQDVLWSKHRDVPPAKLKEFGGYFAEFLSSCVLCGKNPAGMGVFMPDAGVRLRRPWDEVGLVPYGVCARHARTAEVSGQALVTAVEALVVLPQEDSPLN